MVSSTRAWAVLGLVAAMALVLVALAPMAAAQEGGDADAAEAQANVAAMDKLFQSVSSECQAEIQAGMEDQSYEISEGCKREVQEKMEAQNIKAGGAAAGGDAGSTVPASSGFISPVTQVLLFCFVAVGGLIYLGYSRYKQLPASRKKPLSKKKELKARQKGR